MQERLLFPGCHAVSRVPFCPHKSDAYRLTLCGHCGRIACHDGKDCAVCTKNKEIRGGPVTSVVPYSFKLLLQEMGAMAGRNLGYAPVWASSRSSGDRRSHWHGSH